MQEHFGPLRRPRRADRRERRLCATAHPRRRRTERRRQDDLRARRRRDRQARFRDARDRRPRSRPRSSSIDARAAGVELVHQSFALPPSFTVAEAMEFGAEAGPPDLHRREPRCALEATSRKSRGSAPGSPIASAICRSSPQQGVEIARALVADAKLLILDEPTAVLSPSGIEMLFQRLRGLKAERRHHFPRSSQDPRGPGGRRHGHSAARRAVSRGAARGERGGCAALSAAIIGVGAEKTLDREG